MRGDQDSVQVVSDVPDRVFGGVLNEEYRDAKYTIWVEDSGDSGT